MRNIELIENPITEMLDQVVDGGEGQHLVADGKQRFQVGIIVRYVSAARHGRIEVAHFKRKKVVAIADGAAAEDYLAAGKERRHMLGRQAAVKVLPEVLATDPKFLRRFEREGWVALGREQIQITNSAALRELSATLAA